MAMLTDRALRALKPRKSPYLVAVGDPALYVEVQPGGTLTFLSRLRLNGNANADRIRHGNYPDLSLKRAREKHAEARRLIDEGRDPRVVMLERRQADEAARRAQRSALTVDKLADEFIEQCIVGTPKKPGRKRQDEPKRILKRYVRPALGNELVKDLDRQAIMRVLSRLAGRAPVMANRTLALLKQMFAFAVAHGYMQGNPIADVKRKNVGGDEKPRDRVLSDAEISTLWSKLDSAPGTPDVKAAVRILLATGVRQGELIRARWEHVDFNSRQWTIPAAAAKQARARSVPLNDMAVEEFAKLHALAGFSDYVLPSWKGERRIAESHVSDKAIDKAIERARQHIGIAHWTAHDLRRTLRTNFSQLGVQPHVAEKALGHALQGVLRVYDQHDYLAEQRDAFDRWGAKIASVTNAETAAQKVVPIKKRSSGRKI